MHIDNHMARRIAAAASWVLVLASATDEQRCAAPADAPEDSAALLQSVARWHPRAADYDCDGDGVQDCGMWDRTRGACSNPAYCSRSWKFGDKTLDSSCRCRRCSGGEFIGTAFGDPNLRKASPTSGVSQPWGTFRVWANHIDSCAPWSLYKTDSDLRSALAYAKSKGYKVRISGAGGSSGGIVTDGKDSNAFVVSLGEYVGVLGWEFGLHDMPDGSKRVRVNAGWSLGQLYDKIRLLDFFLPTQTAGYFLTLGGVIANGVHGGHYSRGFIHSHVTRLRVMMHDGTIKEIEDEADLRYWRCSFGLLGIILGIEFQLEKREHLQMEWVKRKLPAWNSEELWRFIMQDAEADIGDAPGNMTGSRKSFSGQFFVDYIIHEEPTAHVYMQRANGSASESFEGPTGLPADAEQHYAAILAREVRDDWHGPLPWRDYVRRDGAPPIRIGGMDVNEIFGGIPALKHLAKVVSSSATSMVETNINTMREQVNDGFILTESAAASAAAYFIPPSQAFAALDKLRAVQRSTNCSSDFIWNLPSEFRFVHVDDAAVLQPVEPGFWMAADYIALVDFAENEQSWKKAFKRVQDVWVNDFGAKPHLGKLWGFDATRDGTVEPFSHQAACRIYSEAVKAQFNSYRRQQDPEDLFFSGLGVTMLGPCV